MLYDPPPPPGYRRAFLTLTLREAGTAHTADVVVPLDLPVPVSSLADVPADQRLGLLVRALRSAAPNAEPS